MGLFFCNRMTSILDEDISHSTKEAFEKSDVIRIGAELSACFNQLKACSATSFYTNVPFFNIFAKDFAINP